MLIRVFVCRTVIRLVNLTQSNNVTVRKWNGFCQEFSQMLGLVGCNVDALNEVLCGRFILISLIVGGVGTDRLLCLSQQRS